MKYHTLEDWLAWQTTLHGREIELGLERIQTVARRLDLLDCAFLVVTVAGTNGKGSSAAMFSSILHHAGYKVGTYTSPHIIRYNERIRVGLRCVRDHQLCASFARIDVARQGISLSFFEFATLAALDIFHQAGVDVAVLEVGLGGRLDATNIVDCDLALITSISLDHTEWLGNNRESIGYEKAGILRANVSAICNDTDPPRAIAASAEKINAELYQINADFSYRAAKSSWSFFAGDYQLHDLPLPNLSGAIQIQNAAGVLMGLRCLHARLPVSIAAIRIGLREVTLAGRFQTMVKNCEIIFDVAHNCESAKILSDNLIVLPRPVNTIGVFAVLNDKDVGGIVSLLLPHIDTWHIAAVDSPRAMPAERIQQIVMQKNLNADVTLFASVESAYFQARAHACKGDRIVVFGSIFTVSQALACES